MGYDIYIGEAKPRINEECGAFDWFVERTEHPDAPAFPNDEMTGKSNSRHPGYIAWNDTLIRAGLEELFFGKWDGLMRAHPGITLIKREHAGEVARALSLFRDKYPSAVPRFAGHPRQTETHIPQATDEDAMLARLIWLSWWMNWAVERCQHPAIYNR